MKKGLKLFRGLIILAIVAVAALYTQRVYVGDAWRAMNAPVLPEEVMYEEVTEERVDEEEIASEPPAPRNDDVESVELPTTNSELPTSINLAVPFTSQAPFANWDTLHEETCEEASVYMVHAYYEGVSGRIAAQTAEDELQRLVAKELELFGYYKDTTAAETAELARAMYGYARTEIVADPTVDDLKVLLAAGIPVILPAAGRELGNPNFSGDGPPYHMIVIRGYANGNFITNDPGTRNGEAYIYSEATIMNAMHDWTGSYDTIGSGAKAVLVIYPN